MGKKFENILNDYEILDREGHITGMHNNCHNAFSLIYKMFIFQLNLYCNVSFLHYIVYLYVFYIFDR